jgi:hypothetical protein
MPNNRWPYNTQRWLRTRKRQLMREPLCCVCSNSYGLIVCANDVDHVAPVTRGGPAFDANNLQSLCKTHHSEKTNCERSNRPWTPSGPIGCTVDGAPIIGCEWTSPESNRQTEHRVLARPLGRGIAQASNANAVRQSSFDGGLDEIGREERERDRHIDLSNAAFLARINLLDTGDGAGNNLIKPTPTTCDRCNERHAGLGADRSTVVERRGGRHDDFPSPLH